MSNCFALLKSTNVNLKRNIYSSKFLLLFLIFLTGNINYLGNLNRISRESGININLFVYSLIFENPGYLIFTFTAISIFYSNLPFNNGFQLNLITRLGKIKWQVSNLLYIFMSSLIILTTHLISVVICLIPNIYISKEWGRFLWGYSNSTNIFKTIIIKSNVLEFYTPIKATLLVMSIFFCLIVIFGLLNLVFNKNNKNFGKIICVLILFKSLIVTEEFYRLRYYLSPLNWITLNNIYITNEIYPSSRYIYITLVISIVILIIISLLQMNKKSEINIGRS